MRNPEYILNIYITAKKHVSTQWNLGYMNPQTETVQATPAAAHFSPVPMAPQDR